nr:hypothetical protein [Mesotoga sp.]
GRVYNFLTTDRSAGFVVDEPPADLVTWMVSIDYGQQHPTCMGLWGYSLSERCWYLVKEFYTKEKTNVVYSQEFGREMLHYRGNVIIPQSVEIDPGGGGSSLITQFRADYPNLTINSAHKKDVIDEIQSYAGAIFTHAVRFCSSCKRAIDEHMSYLWDEKAKERGVEQPIKLNDDGPDMGRYFWNRAKVYK